MSERLWVGSLSPTELEAWLKPPRDAARFAILERLDDIAFPASHEPISLERWTQGRIFGPDYELRWEKRDKQYRVWLTGTREPEGFQALDTLRKTQMRDTKSFLWGKHERRIARQLEYRELGEGSGRAEVVRREFRAANGALVCYRNLRMQWEGEHEPV